MKQGSIIGRVYNHYVRNAKLRNIIWRLDRKQFIELVTHNCFYCGAEPQPRKFPRWSIVRKKTETFMSKEALNGVDRINNKKGYEIENCVPCCWKCNRAKGNLDLNEFLILLAKILENHGKSIDWLNEETNHLPCNIDQP